METIAAAPQKTRTRPFLQSTSAWLPRAKAAAPAPPAPPAPPKPNYGYLADFVECQNTYLRTLDPALLEDITTRFLMPIVHGYFATSRLKGMYDLCGDAEVLAAVEVCRRKLHRYDPTKSSAMNYFTKVAQRVLWAEQRKEAAHKRHYFNESDLQAQGEDDTSVADLIEAKQSISHKEDVSNRMHAQHVVSKLRSLSPQHATIMDAMIDLMGLAESDAQHDEATLPGKHTPPTIAAIAAHTNLSEVCIRSVLEDLKAIGKPLHLGC